MKILVTGGAGYIGAHVVRQVAESGHTPVILDDLRRSRKDRTGDFQWENVALENVPAVVGVFEKHRPDAVIHLAGYISVAESVSKPAMYWQNNVAASSSLILASSKYPVRSFLFSSTAAVYGNAQTIPIPEIAPLNPTCPYGESKLVFEQLLHTSCVSLGYRSFALRYFNAAGAHPSWHVGEAHDPEEHLIPRVIRALLARRKVQVYGRDYPTPDGTCVRDYIHVTDLASAHVKVIETADLKGPASMNVGTGRGFSVLQVIDCIGRHLGLKPDIEFLPRRPGDPAVLVADASRLQREISWRPVHSSLDEIVASAIAWEHMRSK